MNWAVRLCWKEYREQRLFWSAIAGLSAVLVVGLVAAMAPGGRSAANADSFVQSSLLATVLVMAATYAVVCAGLLFAGEQEARTQAFLDMLPARRHTLWMGKITIGLVLVLAQTLVLLGLCLVYQLPLEVRGSTSIWLPFLVLALAWNGFAWGACAAVQCRSVLGAAGLAVVLQFVASTLVALLALLIPPALLVGVVLLPVAALVISHQIYTAPDRQRRPEAVDRSQGRLAPTAWRVLLWLCWRQGKAVVIACFVAAFVLSFLFPWQGVWLWPLGTLALGLVCGIEVFAGEQSSGANKFLGDQRIPPWKLWLAKVLFWLAVAAGSAAVFLLLGALLYVNFGIKDYNSHFDSLVNRFFHDQKLPPDFISPLVFVALWLPYGFSLGLLAAQLLRKPIIAVVVAAALSALLLAPWLPSLLWGGFTLGPLLVVPLVLLAASFLQVRPWLSQRLTSWRVLAGMGAVAAFIPLWIAGNLYQRATAIPDLGEPFDVRAFLADVPQDREATFLIREAAKEMQERRKLADNSTKDVPKENAELPALEENHEPTMYEQAEKAMKEGWPKDDDKLDRWLDILFAGDWDEKLYQVRDMPLAVLVNLRTINYGTLLPEVQECREACFLLNVRAARWQSQGKQAEALEDMLTALALANHVRNYGPTISLLVGNSIEAITLEQLDRWLAKGKPGSELLRQALQQMTEYEQRVPPIEQTLHVEYLTALHSLDNIDLLLGERFSPLVKLSRQVPWEKERQWRFLHFLGQLDQEYLAVLPDQRYALEKIQERGQPPYYLAATRSSEEIQATGPAHRLIEAAGGLHRIIGSEGWSTGYRVYDNYLFRARFWGIYHRRAAQLKIALALYEAERGHAPAHFQQLVPRYLPELPVNPFTGEPFAERPLPVHFYRQPIPQEPENGN